MSCACQLFEAGKAKRPPIRAYDGVRAESVSKTSPFPKSDPSVLQQKRLLNSSRSTSATWPILVAIKDPRRAQPLQAFFVTLVAQRFPQVAHEEQQVVPAAAGYFHGAVGDDDKAVFQQSGAPLNRRTVAFPLAQEISVQSGFRISPASFSKDREAGNIRQGKPAVEILFSSFHHCSFTVSRSRITECRHL